MELKVRVKAFIGKGGTYTQINDEIKRQGGTYTGTNSFVTGTRPDGNDKSITLSNANQLIAALEVLEAN